MRKAARESIARFLEDKLHAIQREVLENRHEFHRLRERQTILKRSRGELILLIRSLREKK